MDIKKLFINCMVVLCVVVVIFSVVTVVKRGNEPEDKNEITHDLMENSEIVVGTEFTEDTESNEVGVEVDPVETRSCYTISKVNVRTGPATTYDAIIELAVGVEVTAVGELDEAGWQKIIYDGQEAYILGRYLSDEAPEEDDDEDQQASNGNQTSNGGTSQSASQSQGQQSNLNNYWWIQDAGATTTPTTTPSSEETGDTSGSSESTTTPETQPTVPETTPVVPETTPTVPETPVDPAA